MPAALNTSASATSKGAWQLLPAPCVRASASPEGCAGECRTPRRAGWAESSKNGSAVADKLLIVLVVGLGPSLVFGRWLKNPPSANDQRPTTPFLLAPTGDTMRHLF